MLKTNWTNIANSVITQLNAAHPPRTRMPARNERQCVKNVLSATTLAKALVVLAVVHGIKSVAISATDDSVTLGNKASRRVPVRT